MQSKQALKIERQAYLAACVAWRILLIGLFIHHQEKPCKSLAFVSAFFKVWVYAFFSCYLLSSSHFHLLQNILVIIA